MIVIEDIHAKDLRRILELNEREVIHTSTLNAARLSVMRAECSYFRKASLDGELVGFVIAFDEKAQYDSPNFRWFQRAYAAFVYIDRVVVDERVRSRGIASRLYADVEQSARLRLVTWLACEFNVFPPNEPSLRFHEKLGFFEVGQLEYRKPRKVVSLRLRKVGASDG